ncbi:MAG: SDR family oxidoreductase [Candidatus Omnitrophica bacterium]|nr:SDR family oxidoreductase [Candidatus Omnitrophota bacterium]MDD5549784.1 SDR family oxidoreductase [Candidatus Omnitrophota bacterium]
MKRNNRTVVITGGAGFIGSHLCDFLINKNYKVICLDNLITGNRKNIAHLLNNPLFEFKNIDVSKKIEIKVKVDFVLHFASPASPVIYLAHPIETLKVGAFGTFNCLELAKSKKAKFLLASTSEIYGDPKEHPQKESYWGNVSSIGPRSVYDEAKRFAEAVTMAYHRRYNIDTKIVRIFNTYGPRMLINDGRAVPNFIMQALKNKPLTIQGDGMQTRSFCFISDLVEGIFQLMNSSANDPVNLGNPTEVTIRKIAKLIIELTHSKSKIKYLALPQDDPKRRKPDIAKAKRLLNWEPKVGLKEGLVSTIFWFETAK